ncbi:MAG: haloacid dehalogenase, partial [Acidobacteriota bacterium]
DLPTLTSGLNAIMVRNTRPEVQREAGEIARRRGFADRLYTAKGDWQGMNGNYSAGVLEGVAHFFPESQALM